MVVSVRNMVRVWTGVMASVLEVVGPPEGSDIEINIRLVSHVLLNLFWEMVMDTHSFITPTECRKPRWSRLLQKIDGGDGRSTELLHFGEEAGRHEGMTSN